MIATEHLDAPLMSDTHCKTVEKEDDMKIKDSSEDAN